MKRYFFAGLLVISGCMGGASFAAGDIAPPPPPSPVPSAAVSPSAALPRVELRLPQKEAWKVGDVIRAELVGSALPNGAKLGAVSKYAEGYTVSMDGGIGLTKAGPVQLPALIVVDASGAAIAETDPVALQVTSALGDQPAEAGKEPKPEPPIGPQELTLPLGIRVGVVVLLVLIIGSALFFPIRYLLRRFSRPRPTVHMTLTADAIALRRLSQVESEQWFTKGNPKRHAFEISEALKAYFSDRYTMDARESTMTELMERLADLREARRLDDEQLRAIRNCFSVLDLVKFTDYKPADAESVAQLEEARQIVVHTKEAPRLLAAGEAGTQR